jgi:hypothetical protein
MSPHHPFLFAGLSPLNSMSTDLMPQSPFGNLMGGFGQPVGGLVSGLLGNRPFGTFGGNFPRLLPFEVDPLNMLAAQQNQGAAGGQQTQQTQTTQDLANLENEAINTFLQDAASNSIRKLFDYLEKNSQKYPQLAPYPAVVSQAVEAFKNKNYSQALAIAYQAHRAIIVLRAAVPDLPSPQTV